MIWLFDWTLIWLFDWTLIGLWLDFYLILWLDFYWTFIWLTGLLKLVVESEFNLSRPTLLVLLPQDFFGHVKHHIAIFWTHPFPSTMFRQALTKVSPMIRRFATKTATNVTKTPKIKDADKIVQSINNLSSKVNAVRFNVGCLCMIISLHGFTLSMASMASWSSDWKYMTAMLGE